MKTNNQEQKANKEQLPNAPIGTSPATLFNDEIEERIICCILTNNESYYKAGDLLKANLFYNIKNRKAFNEITKGLNKGIVVDTVYLATQAVRSVKDGEESYTYQEVLDKFSSYVSSSMLDQDLKYLLELRKRRRIWTLGCKLINIGSNISYSVEDAMSAIEKVAKDDESDRTGILTMAQANAQMMEKVRDNIAGKSNTYIPTGFHDIDDNAGFQTTDFNIIAGSTSMGKTAFALKIATSAAKYGRPVMIYSMEMIARQLAARINSPIANISSSVIQYKPLYEDNFNELQEAVKLTNSLPIYYDESSTKSKEAIIKSIRLNAKKGIKLFIVDYLQILSSVSKITDKTDFLGEVSRDFKDLARELDVNITALSQLSRNTQNPAPNIDRLRDSAEIASAADTILMIWRPSAYGITSYKGSNAPVKNTAQIIIAKGRNVGKGSFIVGFNPEYTEFYDIPEEEKSKWGKTNKKEDDLSLPEEKDVPF